MDDFVRFGSQQACNLLKQVGSARYETTCYGYENAQAYYQAGLIFWGAILVAVLLMLFLVKKAINYTFK